MRETTDQLLHAYFGSRRGDTTRARIPSVILPVFGPTTVVSLRHACLAAGLFDDVRGDRRLNWGVLGELATEKWARSAQRFLADAARVGAGAEQADAALSGIKGAVIGRSEPVRKEDSGPDGPFGICPDLNLSLGVLARRVGGLFIASRPPAYDWGTLFDEVLHLDDDLVPAVPLTEAPWSGFAWDFDGYWPDYWL